MPNNEISYEDALLRLKRGDALTFPTDTVMGVGVSPVYAPSPDVLYEIKGRPSNKPISWLVPCIEDLVQYGEDVSNEAIMLARSFWPGPLTLVVKASSRVPAQFVSSEGTIGLRMPKHSIPLSLMGSSGINGPLATTSANFSGDADSSRPDEVDNKLLMQAPLVVISEPSAAKKEQGIAIASTVVSCIDSQPRILREGSISLSDIKASLI